MINNLEINFATLNGKATYAVTNSETEGVYLPAEAKLNMKGCLLGCSSPGHFEVDVSKFHTLKWKVSAAFIQLYV